MKYLVRFELKEPNIRVNYREIFISFFKKSISSYMDGYFFDDLYNAGTMKKSLVWSVNFQKPIFKKGEMELAGKDVNMTLKIGDSQTALIYYSSMLLMKDKAFPIGNANELKLKSIKMINESDIVGDYTVFKVFSPICLKQHHSENNKDRYLTADDAEFGLELGRKLKEDLPYMDEEIDNLKYDFSKLKKVIVPIYKVKIPATIGSFEISGDNKILNHILKNGVGSKRNSGFGLVEQAF
jgi:CRISPR-associated endoribonuclease cas6